MNKRGKKLLILDSYKEAIMIMMRYGGSLNDIALKLDVPYEYLLKYLNKNGILEKLKNRSWTYK